MERVAIRDQTGRGPTQTGRGKGVTQIGEHESKFVLPNLRAEQLRSWLSRKCQSDPDYAEGHISSIYFDTSDFRLLNEKLASDYLKTKIRLRWYSSLAKDVTFPTVFLEIKNKIGSARQKKRLALTVASKWIVSHDLEDPAYLAFNHEIARQGCSIAQSLHPVLQISYRRSRYIDPLSGARLSLDCDIHVARINRRMVNDFRPWLLPVAVFECKEKTGILPDWLHQVNAFGGRKAAFSKYSECYAHIQQIIY